MWCHLNRKDVVLSKFKCHLNCQVTKDHGWRICRGVTQFASQKGPDDEVQLDDGETICRVCHELHKAVVHNMRSVPDVNPHQKQQQVNEQIGLISQFHSLERCEQPFARIRATKRSPANWTAAQVHTDCETKVGAVNCLCNKEKQECQHISPSKSCICVDIKQFFSKMMVLYRGKSD